MLKIIYEGLIPLLTGGTKAAIPLLVIGYILCAIIAYLLGSLNFAMIISRKKFNDDIRNHGSGNAGMTNMLRTYGKGAAGLTILGDALKAVVAIFIGWVVVGMHLGGGYVAGLCCILGHVYPCFFGFRGGKGVVVSAATMLMLNPAVFAVIIAIFVITVALTRYISLGSCIGAALYPFFTFYITPQPSRGPAFLFAFVIGAFVIFLHRENLKRLAHGTESKFSLKSKK